jgi:Fe-S cluster assembly protein SufD
MSEKAESTQKYRDALRRLPALPGANLKWVAELRDRGSASFGENGFPTTRMEEWKYTDAGPIARAEFMPISRSTNGIDSAGVAGFAFRGLPVHRLVFVNGHYSAQLSRTGPLPDGATVTGIADAFSGNPDLLEPHLGRHAPADAHGFAALNAALFPDGALVHLRPGTVVDEPIHVLYILTADGASGMATPRNLFVAEPNSKATVIEHYVSTTGSAYLTNTVTEVEVHDNAQIEHYRLQEESTNAYHVNGLHVHIDRDARFTSHGIDFGSRLARNELSSLLAAEGAHCVLNGLYAVTGRQHVDNHTQIDHAKPSGTSREFYKGVLDGRARSVFHGRVVVHPDAQHSDAQQVNNNLLLSKDAEADTKPQLEIYADDVRCSHGATVGQLDPDALFYLRSRAIDEPTARDLLTYAFAKDVLNRMDLESVRDQLEQHLASGMLHGRKLKELELV